MHGFDVTAAEADIRHLAPAGALPVLQNIGHACTGVALATAAILSFFHRRIWGLPSIWRLR